MTEEEKKKIKKVFIDIDKKIEESFLSIYQEIDEIIQKASRGNKPKKSFLCEQIALKYLEKSLFLYEELYDPERGLILKSILIQRINLLKNSSPSA